MPSEPRDMPERAVLGSMLRDQDAIADVVQLIGVEDFRVDAHRKVFAAIVALWDSRRPVELPMLADELNNRGQIEDLGGYGLLAELLEEQPTGSNASYYAKAVRDHAMLRTLERVGHELVDAALRPTDSAERLVEEGERKVFAIGQRGLGGTTCDLAEAINGVYEKLDARRASGRLAGGLPTGLRSLDELLAGLQNGELIVLAARPSVGKTTLGLHLARHAAVVEKVPAFIASLEQGRHELAERLLCAVGGVDGQQLRHGKPTDREVGLLGDAGDVLRPAPIIIDDSPVQRMIRIASNARRLKARRGIGLVVVDYLQLIEPENYRSPRHEQVAGISRRLKQLARELDIPVVALAQLNRASEDRQEKKPRLSDLRESGAIEADADTVLLLHKPEMEKFPNRLQVIVAKQRNGPQGTALVEYHRSTMRFADADDSPFAGNGQAGH